MTAALRTLAIIPARGGSRRVPGKNIRPFLGRPLIRWSLEFARSMNQFDQVFVSTDSDDIARCCEAGGLPVRYRRPAALATDTATSVDVAVDALDAAERGSGAFDLVALIQPTTPMRDSARWGEAFTLICSGSCDAVVGVSAARTHPHHVFKQMPDSSLVPWIGREGLSVRSQDLPPAVNVCGALYLIRTSTLRAARTFFPERTKSVLCEAPWESIDIDTEADWIVAEALARHYGKVA